MEFFSLDILHIIFSFCDFRTLNSIKNTNKNFFKKIKESFILEYDCKKLEFVKDILQKTKFKKVFMNELNKDVIFNLRYLDIKNRISYDGFINFIEKKDFDQLNTNIVYGYDFHDRFFISILFHTTYKNRIYYKILTIFQRYSNNENYYISSQDKLYNYPFNEKIYVINDKIHSLNENFIKDIFSLLNKKKLIVEKKYKSYIYNFDKL